jgi:hypothetical protein
MSSFDGPCTRALTAALANPVCLALATRTRRSLLKDMLYGILFLQPGALHFAPMLHVLVGQTIILVFQPGNIKAWAMAVRLGQNLPMSQLGQSRRF